MISPKVKCFTSSVKSSFTNFSQSFSSVDYILIALVDLLKSQEIFSKNSKALGHELKSLIDSLTSQVDTLSTKITNKREMLLVRVLALNSRTPIVLFYTFVN